MVGIAWALVVCPLVAWFAAISADNATQGRLGVWGGAVLLLVLPAALAAGVNLGLGRGGRSALAAACLAALVSAAGFGRLPHLLLLDGPGRLFHFSAPGTGPGNTWTTGPPSARKPLTALAGAECVATRDRPQVPRARLQRTGARKSKRQPAASHTEPPRLDHSRSPQSQSTRPTLQRPLLRPTTASETEAAQ